MVGGMAVLTTTAAIQNGMTVFGRTAQTCPTNPANWKLGLAMYCSYFILFVTLFVKKYNICGGSDKKLRRVMSEPEDLSTSSSGPMIDNGKRSRGLNGAKGEVCSVCGCRRDGPSSPVQPAPENIIDGICSGNPQNVDGSGFFHVTRRRNKTRKNTKKVA